MNVRLLLLLLLLDQVVGPNSDRFNPPRLNEIFSKLVRGSRSGAQRTPLGTPLFRR